MIGKFYLQWADEYNPNSSLALSLSHHRPSSSTEIQPVWKSWRPCSGPMTQLCSREFVCTCILVQVVNSNFPSHSSIFLILMRSANEFRRQKSFSQPSSLVHMQLRVRFFQMEVLIKFSKRFQITKCFYKLIPWFLLDIAPQLGRLQYTTHNVKTYGTFFKKNQESSCKTLCKVRPLDQHFHVKSHILK